MGEFPSKKHQFKKGNPGGPGRPKGDLSIVAALRRTLDQERPELKGKKIADAIAERLVRMALEGDFKAIKELIDRFDGPIKQEIAAAITRVEVEYVNKDDDE